MFRWLEVHLPSFKYKSKIMVLEAELSKLRWENDKLLKIKDRIEKTDLPYCEDRVCSTCVHAQIQTYTAGLVSREILVGCRKHRDCKDYVPVKKY